MRLSLPCLLLVLLLAFFSCKKNNAGNPTTSTSSLIGTWEWVQQTNAIDVFGYPYDTLTPGNTDTTGILTMGGDGLWLWTVNNKTIDQGTFDIDSFPSPAGYISSLVFNGGNDKFLTFIDSKDGDSIVNHVLSPDNDSLYITNALIVNNQYTVSIFVRQNSSGIIPPATP